MRIMAAAATDDTSTTIVMPNPVAATLSTTRACFLFSIGRYHMGKRLVLYVEKNEDIE